MLFRVFITPTNQNIQCYGGKPIFEFDRARLFRSGLVGFTLHGSLSHYYYQLCEVIIVNLWFGTVRLLLCEGLKLFALFSQALFPFQQWWVVPAKVAFDQTVWSAIWNSIYFVVLGLLRLDSFTDIYGELKSTFWPMLTVQSYIVFVSLCYFRMLSVITRASLFT